MSNTAEMHQYSYDGPVKDDTGCYYKYRWQSSTVAPSEKKALSNLMFRFKKENGIFQGERLSLPGKITMVD